MDGSIVGMLLSYWWQICAILLTVVFAVIAIQVTVQFDVNVWLEYRRKSKEMQERMDIASACKHMWTLYRDYPYSRCNMCHAFISTSTLLFLQEFSDEKPPIMGEGVGMGEGVNKGDILVKDAFGGRLRRWWHFW